MASSNHNVARTAATYVSTLGSISIAYEEHIETLTLQMKDFTAALQSLKQALEMSNILAVNQAERTQLGVVLRLGPHEWLIETVAREPIGKTIAEAIAGHDFALVDHGRAHGAFSLCGPSTIDVLRAGCAIDLHPLVFKTNMATRTILAHMNVALWCVRSPGQWRLYVDCSYSDYAASWLTRAASAYLAST